MKRLLNMHLHFSNCKRAANDEDFAAAAAYGQPVALSSHDLQINGLNVWHELLQFFT